MRIKDIPSILCAREGKLSQVKIGDMREIIGILSDIEYEACVSDPYSASLSDVLYVNGMRRANRKKAQSKKRRAKK